MPKTADRVLETTTTTGTGTFTLSGATTGYKSFNSSFSINDPIYYCCQLGSEWEVGVGILLTSTTLSRSVLTSSNSNSLVNFSAGLKNIFCTLPQRARTNKGYVFKQNGVI